MLRHRNVPNVLADVYPASWLDDSIATSSVKVQSYTVSTTCCYRTRLYIQKSMIHEHEFPQYTIRYVANCVTTVTVLIYMVGNT